MKASQWRPVCFENAALVELGKQLMGELKANAERKTTHTRGGVEIAYDEYYGGKSKSTIDEIDRALAQHYGFMDEELDFIINYASSTAWGRPCLVMVDNQSGRYK